MLLWAILLTGNVCQAINFNLDFFPPSHLAAHLFLFANGTVPIATGFNSFANNAIDGHNFLRDELKLSDNQIECQRQKAIEFWRSKFGIDGNTLSPADGEVNIYQIAPRVNERVFMATSGCGVPSEGFPVLDGGFQLFITNPDGVLVIDPQTGRQTRLPARTNLVYSWLIIRTRGDRQTQCLPAGLTAPSNVPRPPPRIIVPFRTLRPTLWTTEAISFDLEITPGNFFGAGVAVGQSAPVVTSTTIANRLMDYVQFFGFSSEPFSL